VVWVLGGDPGDSEELICEEHFGGDPHTEFLDLTMVLAENGIAAPATNQHDGEGKCLPGTLPWWIWNGWNDHLFSMKKCFLAT
jgi:hypothetical protein